MAAPTFIVRTQPYHPGPPPPRSPMVDWRELPRTECLCPVKRVTRRQTAAGERFYSQCQTCGAANAVKKESVTSFANLPEFNEKLRDEWFAARSRQFETERVKVETSARAAWDWWYYELYLKSGAWRDKRELVLSRDQGLCQGCRVARATRVHHLTYERVGYELLFDLISVCEACHERCHPDR